MNTPDQNTLRRLLDYDPTTGGLTWRSRVESDYAHRKPHQRARACHIWNSTYAGKPAFTSCDKDGYLTGSIFGVRHAAHRIIWKWVHGVEPDQIDHINGRTGDNRITNLRSVSRSLNQRNSCLRRDNTSGFFGVHYVRSSRKWKACARNPYGRQIILGVFTTPEEASAAVQLFCADPVNNYTARNGTPKTREKSPKPQHKPDMITVKTTFAHSVKVGKALSAAAKADGRTVSSYIRRVLETNLGLTADAEKGTSPKTSKLKP